MAYFVTFYYIKIRHLVISVEGEKVRKYISNININIINYLINYIYFKTK